MWTVLTLKLCGELNLRIKLVKLQNLERADECCLARNLENALITKACKYNVCNWIDNTDCDELGVLQTLSKPIFEK